VPATAAPVRPYVLGGVGLGRLDFSLDDEDDEVFGGGAAETKFGFQVGAGLDIPLSGIGTFVEVGYQRYSIEGGSVASSPFAPASGSDRRPPPLMRRLPVRRAIGTAPRTIARPIAGILARTAAVAAPVAAALLAPARARPAAAQGGLGVNPFSVGVSGGLSVPTGDFSDVFASGFNVDGLLAVRAPTLPVSLRIEAGYQRFALKESVRDLLGQFRRLGRRDRAHPLRHGQRRLRLHHPGVAGAAVPHRWCGVYNLRARASGAFAELAEEFGGHHRAVDDAPRLNGGLGLDVPLAGIPCSARPGCTPSSRRASATPTRASASGGRTTIVPLKIGVRF
jgi:hypothetical protein